MPKKSLQWNFPPGTSVQTFGADEYQSIKQPSSADDFQKLLTGISEAVHVDAQRLAVSNNTAIPQLATLAIKEALSWVIKSGGAAHESGEYADIFRAFWLSLGLLRRRDGWSGNQFDPVVDPRIDPTLRELFDVELGRVRANSLHWGIESGYFQLSDSAIGPSLRRSLQARRSALSCLTEYAAREMLPPDLRGMLDDSNSDKKDFWQRLGFHDAEIVTRGMAGEWRRLLEELDLTEQILVQFVDFFGSNQLAMGQLRQVADGKQPVWLRLEDLRNLWTQFFKADSEGDAGLAAFERALELYTLCPEDEPHLDMKKWVPVPLFLRVGDWYLPYLPSLLMMHPSLVTFNMLMHKHEREWSQTIGGSAASVETWLRDQLAGISDHCLFATGAQKKPLRGDIDLAIYDRNSRVLVVCEIKTVFNRFRSVQQLRSFTKGRYDKAIEQLTPKIQALREATLPPDATIAPRWELKDLFSNRIDAVPEQIVPIVLNWWDAFDYTIGTPDEEILCCNIRAFVYLFRQCAGRLDWLVEAIRTLSGVFCVAQGTGRTLRFAGQEIEFFKEDFLNTLPVLDELRSVIHRRFIIDQLKVLPAMPRDWEAKARASGIEPGILRRFEFYRRKTGGLHRS